MRIYVASWFFPPATSSEGIVTYKLLRNSAHEYDVCSAASNQWGYSQQMQINAQNIQVFPISLPEHDPECDINAANQEDLNYWKQAAIETFEREHAKQPYDAIMTRTMPPESISVGAAIKKAHPEIKWIASIADPLARNPYTTYDIIFNNDFRKPDEQEKLVNALSNGFTNIEPSDPGVEFLRQTKELEDTAINGADALIFPCDTLRSYMLNSRRRKHSYTIPHSFDRELIPELPLDESCVDENCVTFTYLGHTDSLRSLDPFIKALHYLQQNNEEIVDHIHLRCIGHIPEHTRDLIYNYYLYDNVSVEPSVDYATSLAIMNDSEWLVHVDAYFDELKDTGGSIFFAGKIADYFSSNAPILGITGYGSPAEEMITQAGGLCTSSQDITQLAKFIKAIAEGRIHIPINRAYRDQFAAPIVSRRFDTIVTELVENTNTYHRDTWPVVAPSKHEEKLVSICIPSYNVEVYLDRCLYSLMSCKYAENFDVIIVNDGSKDSTIDIALEWQAHYPGIISVIDKPNGGHGSTINAALKQAQGRYFRVIDGDDWVDVKSYDEQIDNIYDKNVDADLISSNYYQVFIEDGHNFPWDKKGPNEYYKVYDFATSDFTMEYFAMASVMFKTDIMREADFKIQEHTFYVDVEFLLFPIPYVKTVLFAPEYVYRYAVGNADQSINPATFTSRYDHHDRVIRRMLEYFKQHEPSMSEGQVKYVRSLFERHLLQSHYVLSLVWDPDRNRGLARAKDFDNYLHDLDVDLWKSVAKDYLAIANARHKGFDPSRISKPADINDGGKMFRMMCRRCKNRLTGGKFYEGCKRNRIVRRVYFSTIGRGRED